MPAIWIPKRLVETSLINTAAESAKSFVSHCEIEYESRVYAAAGEVLASGCHVVMLTGPSASGKTTSAHKLAAALERRGCPAQVVSLDNFYLNLNDYPRLPGRHQGLRKHHRPGHPRHPHGAQPAADPGRGRPAGV